ncbi:MAG TPA: 2Fe-2S iron-sulfur cluster-binding protein, partial [Burkholderiales bacterium]|nr:2Fe-2S iron-sulfur cluster-binding protein [Burkholderiales bacterium]
MARIKVLPHATLCPQGAEFDTPTGMSVLDALLEQHIDLEHACEKSCACTTCHVILRQGFESLDAAAEKEED